MRLTLRTLLGYLDDILEPQQTKELGEKIAESGFAAALVERIREVVRRRRISAPDVSGPGSEPDANIVAEYLDNTLAPEKVEDLERLCLDSDMHLAEVASCHQILTMILGEPVEVSQATRERMYALGAVSVEEAAARARTAASVPAPAAALPAPAPQVPEYLTRGSRWRALLPGGIALLIIGVWLGLIFSDPTQTWRIWETQAQQEAASPQATAGSVAAVAADAAGQEAAEVVEAPVAPPGKPVESSAPLPETTPPAAEPTAATEAPAVAAATAPPAPGSSPMPPATGTAPLPTSPIPGAAADATPAAGPPAAAAPQAVAPVAQPVPETKLMYNAVEGVLLTLADPGDWMVLPRRTMLHPGDELASPEPFDSSIQCLDGDCEIVLGGGSRIAIEAPSAAGRPALLIKQGRLQFRRSAVAPLPDPTSIELRLGDHRFLLELLTPGATCGLEVLPRPFAIDPLQPLPPSFDGGLFVTAGEVRCTPDAANPVVLTPVAGFLQFTDGVPAAGAQPLLTAPEWMTPLTGGAATVAQQTARLFEESFQLDQTVDATIPALVDDRHPRIAELAAKTMALTDNFRGMIRALSAENEEARQAGLVGLGVWLRNDPGRNIDLRQELSRSFSDETALILERLIWGFTEEDARDPDVSMQLVGWLNDANLAVREGAYFHILRLTGGQITYRYHPTRTEFERSRSVKQWEAHLRRVGALLEPDPMPIDPMPATETPPADQPQPAPQTTEPTD